MQDSSQTGSTLAGLHSAGAEGSDDACGRIRRALQAVRGHLGLQVAYVSRISGNHSIFREVDAPGLEHLIKAGDRRSLDDVYCRHILEGRLPELIPDTSLEPLAASMPITKAASIGSHISVPIRLSNGETYGMFCCIGFAPDPSLNERDLQTLKAFAALAAFEINREQESARVIDDKRSKVRRAVELNELAIVFQPIWDVSSMTPVGFECLSRFAGLPRRPPDEWFADAAAVGMGPELEVEAIRRSLEALRQFPDTIYLGVNASPATIMSADFAEVFVGKPLHRLIVELTEHATVCDYEELLAALRPLREAGLRLAIDDAGAGYSSLRHILNMRPEFIKLDIGLTQNIDLDPARKALARALVVFAQDTGSRIIAEGVERQSELDALRSIGVKKVQGYLLGRPMDLEQGLRLTADSAKVRVSAA